MAKTKVLYVEDEIFLARIVSESLQDRGYDVVMESDGGQALEQFRKVSPDVCVLDIMLPNKDGFTIADEIRDINEQVPIIFLSAKSQSSDVVQGFKVGANDYIRKPFSVEELIARIENVLRHRGETAGNSTEEISLGRYLFHPRRQTLQLDSAQRKLSYRENELLRLLVINRDQVVERSEILNLLWGSDSFFNSRNLDVYVTKLRGYLKDDPDVQIITIKGIGYRFVCS